MRIFIEIILLVVVGIFIIPDAGFSADIDVGQVIEMSPDRKFIQVKDRIYKVDKIERLAVKGKPEIGDVYDLSEGDIVRVVRGQKEESYWYADLVTLYQGELEKMIREKMELPDQQDNKINTSQQQIEKKASSTPMVFENGVWRN